MKNKLLITLLAFLSQSFIFAQDAQDADDCIKVRLNAIHVNEVEFFGVSDPGEGITAEVAFIVDEKGGVFQSIGFEIGYITSEIDEKSPSALKYDVELIPYFVNYTIGGDIGESGFIWEAGAGLGGLSIEVDNGKSNDDLVVGGQFFGSLGYEFSETFSLLAGMRYMTSSESDVSGDSSISDDEVLNSMAIDLSLSFTF